MTIIKHLVISAGGHNGFRSYGAVRATAEFGVWKKDDLESIWASSSGAIVGVMVALGYDWEWLDDYLVKRPWDDVMGADERMLSLYTDGGVYGEEVVEETLCPLLEAKGFARTVTIAEFSEATQVDMYCIATNLNGPGGFEKIVFGPDTTPDCPVLTAVAASAAYPIMFKPVRYNRMCLIDGAVFSLYPMTECVESGAQPDTILGFKNDWGEICCPVPENANLLDFSGAMITRFWQGTCSTDHQTPPPDGVREVVCKCSFMTCDAMRAALTNQNERERLILEGEADAHQSMAKWKHSNAPSPPPKSTETIAETAQET
jgi:predicted acylesterase/phospholipase RssA